MVAADPRHVVAERSAATGDSLAALSRMLGRNEAYLHQFVARGSPRRLADRDRRLLADHFGIDETLLGADPAASRAVRIARLTASASAGPGTLVDSELPAGSASYDAKLVARLGIDPAAARAVRVRGDSMLPTLVDGDVILVDERDRRIDGGGVFLIRIGDALMVKRVSREGGRPVATSDNPAADPLPAHDAGELAVIGRVVWLSRVPR